MKSGFFISNDGSRRFYRGWTIDTPSSGTVVISHGYAEHGGRYSELASKLNSAGFDVWIHDYYGHGQSDGKRAEVPNIKLFVKDTELFISEIAVPRDQKKPLFVYGHSMGGTIALLYAIVHQSSLNGLILSGPVVRPSSQSSAIERAAAHMLRKIAPSLKYLPFEPEPLCRDPRVVEAYVRDPLVYSGKMKIRMADEFFHAERLLRDEALKDLKIPLLLMHGGADEVVPPLNSEVVFSLASSPDKTRKIFDGMYHEIHNEPGKEEVFELVCAWLREHV